MFARIVALTAALLSLSVGVALADAPNPIPGTTILDTYAVNPSTGAVTVTISGEWNWTSHQDCPANRDGVGYQVAWFDGDTANAIGQANQLNGVIYVGDAQDDIVHSLNNLDPSNINPAFAGVPASYLAHNATTVAPTQADATNWNSNCGTTNATTQLSTGTWGPISHTYPAGFKGPIEVCPIMYDPHGQSQDNGGSSQGDVTAGGNGHNNDNSYEGNGSSDACDLTSFPTLTSTATTTAHETQAISDVATLSGSSAAQGSISWSLLKYPTGTTAAQISADACKSGSATNGTFTTPVNGNGNYTSPSYTVPTGGAGVYQWLATYNSATSANASTLPTGCGQSSEESIVTPLPAPSLTLTKQQAWDPGGSVPATAQPSPGTYTSSEISGAPGWIVDYRMTVADTGNETLGIQFADPASAVADAGCDAGTLSSTPTVISGTYTPGSAGNGYGGLPTLSSGGEIVYTCKHTVALSDAPWVNTASVAAIDANGTAVSAPNASVQDNAVNPQVGFTKMQTIAGSGAAYTHNPIAGAMGQVADYQLTATNPSKTDSLALSLSDPGCATGTLTAPTGTGVSGTTSFTGAGNTVAGGNVLAPGDSAVYTCAHTIASGDTPFTNTATVTATDTTTQQQLTATDSVSDSVQAPSITVTKGEQVNSTALGAYVHGPVTAYVGDTINYLITVANTGATEVTPTLTDATASGGDCDAGTLKAVSGLSPGGRLAAGASATWTCSHTVTANDPKTLTNTASATAVDDFGNPAAPASDTVTANVLTLTLTLVKEQRMGSSPFTGGSITVNPDDTVDYQMTVTNTSDQALAPHFSDSTFATGDTFGGCDPGTLVAPSNLTNGRIAAGGTAVWTCTHTFDETDPSPFVNTASVYGTDANGHSTPTQTSSVSANLFLNPEMTVVKSQYDATTNPGGSYSTATIDASAGDTIDYLIYVDNTGNEDLALTAVDPGCTSAITGPLLAPGDDSDDLTGNVLEQGAAAEFTCSRVLTVSDAPQFTNTATVTGTPDTGVGAITEKSSVTVNVITSPAFTITKTQSIAGSAFTTSTLAGQVGQVVSYQVTIKNTGNTSLTLSSFSDPQCDVGTIAGGPSGAIAVGQSATYTCQHALTYTDQGVGSYSNQAAVTGTPPAGEGSALSNDSNVVKVTLPAPNPAFTISKTQSTGGSAFTTNGLTGQLGETISYHITITNTGNTPLTFSSFSDSNCDTLAGGPSGPLAVGQSAMYTCQHVIATADQAAGSYTNQAAVTGTPPAGDGSPTTTTSNPVVVTIGAPAPAFTIVKTQAIGNATPATTPITGAVGDIVNYTITVTNTGNTPLTFPVFGDPKCDAATIGGGPGSSSLAPGQSTSWTCTHTITSGDQAAGSYDNVATATADPPSGDGTPVTNTSNTVTVDVPTPAAPGLTIVKLQRDATTEANSKFTQSTITATIGDMIDYQIQVSNTGNLALKLGFTDAGCDAGTLTGPNGGQFDAAGDLTAGSSTVYDCSHVAGTSDGASFTNTATVTGTPPGGSQIGPFTSAVVANIDPANPPVTPATPTKPELHVVKSQQVDGSSAPFTTAPLTAEVGSAINYHLTVTNDGNVALTVDVKDPQCDAGTLKAPATGLSGGELAAGATVVYSCSHKLTAHDSPSFTNTVSVTGTPKGGTATAPATSSVVVNVPHAAVLACTSVTGRAPRLTATKTAAGQPFDATVTGGQIMRVSFFVDGRGYKTVLKPNAARGGFSVRIAPARLSFGAHTLSAKVYVKCGSPLQAKLAFSHPAPKHAVTPQFTG